MTETDDLRPIWFLDVDGVINAISLAAPEKFLQCEASPGGDYGKFQITYNPEVVKFINELHESGDVEIKWLTTWGSGANGELRELLGLPELTVAAEPPLYAAGGYQRWDDSASGWWKLAVVQQEHEANPKRKIIWTDDDISIEPSAIDFINKTKILAIAPHSAKSLQMHDLTKITEYISGYSRGRLWEAVRH